MRRPAAMLLPCAALECVPAANLDVPTPYVPSTRMNVDEMLRLAVDHVSFVIVNDDRCHRFEGRVTGDVMEGVVRSGSGPRPVETRWRAVRISSGESRG